jgi:hypothetical protein
LAFYNLKFLKNLQKLLLTNVSLKESELVFLEYLPSLNTLMIDKNEFIGNKGLKIIYKSCSELINLSIRSNLKVTEDGLFECLYNLPKLVNFIFDQKNKSARISEIIDIRKKIL